MSESKDFDIFTEALKLNESERAQYLRAACGGDDALRQRVQKLLRSFGAAGDFLSQPAAGVSLPKTEPAPPIEEAGSQVGRYKLLQQIGEGGCGVVFMAEQEDPVRRMVALKVIKPGMDTKNVIARFEAERQALALMDHPNIARVIDAGATASGRPYFVMELVRGLKITDYCDRHSLSTADRLQLFIQICGAIQHAHQKGIIHRDIKPSNILITTSEDGKPMPKVIDFGIAKATTGQRLTDKTLFTAFEMLVGTPAYMSPEQAEFTSVDIDTRSDIYSMGVLLYELLTGTAPFDTQELLKAGLDEVRRVIRTCDPVRPSTRLSTMAVPDLTTISQQRHAEPPKLIREVRGDLDWIVMKAMEKDRNRRYATANGLALDVERFLHKEAILARPPSAFYKFQKLFQRNKLVFIGVIVIFLLLIISLGVTTRLVILQRRQLKLTEVVQLETQAINYLRDHQPDQATATLRKSAAMRRQYLGGSAPGPVAELALSSLARVDRWDKIKEFLDDVITPEAYTRPDYNFFIPVRAECYCREGKWDVALPDALLMMKREPDDDIRYHTAAPLAVATTNLEAYRNICSNAVVHLSKTTKIGIAERMAKDCLILPSSGVDLNIVASMADYAVTQEAKDDSNHNWHACCKALAQYRLGNYSEAAKWAQDSAKNDFPYSQAEAYAVLAMAQSRLGNKNDAREALTNCTRVIQTKMPAEGQKPGEDWRDWIIAHALQKEANELINHAGQ